MHTLDINSSNVPAFLIKLWKLVEDASCDDLIAWSDSGASFIIKDQSRFARELLPQYFKHNNMASFVRQLNMYGFRKVMNYEKTGLRNENNEMEFQHAFFVKEQSELLELIKRKIPNTRVVAETHVRSNPKDILTDLTSIRDKQESMDNMLIKMKQDNEMLWKELSNMRQKHKQQEQVIEKVIHFLVQVLRNQPVGVGIQRKMPRMLHDSPGNKGSTSQITTVDIMQKKPECIIVQDKNSSGPVIHEITDMDLEESLSSSAQSPIMQIKSPASKSSSKSPAPNIVIFSPVEKTSNNKEEESGNIINDCPLNSSSLNSPINSTVPIEPLSILDPLQPRTPAENEDETDGDDSVLGIPLEYITANDVVSSMNILPACNVISIPEDNIVSNIISIPEGTEINDVISIPMGSNITEILAASSNNSSQITNSSISTTANINSTSDTTINSNDLSTGKNGDSVTIPDFYDLQPDSVISIKSPLDSSLVNHNYIDPLMSDSLQTPKISLAEDLGLTDFTIEDKKQKDSSKESSLSSPVNITQREHDYPAIVSSSSSNGNSSSLSKNTLSNHLLTVEEQLTRLQDHLTTNSWDVDADKLLGVCHSWATTCFPQLFSSDGMVSNDSFVSQLTDGITIKKEPEDILGNELQFTPQLLGVELDELRSPFLNQLDPDVLDPDNMTDDIGDKNIDVLKQELTDITDEDKNSQSSEILNNDALDNFPNKRRKIMRPQKMKSKRKLK